MNKKIASEIAVGVIFLIAIAFGGIFWMQGKKESSVGIPEVKQVQKAETVNQQQEKNSVVNQEAVALKDIFPIENVDTSKLGKLQSSSTKEEAVEGSPNLKIKAIYETYEKEPNYVNKYTIYNNGKEVVNFSFVGDISFDLFKKISETVYYFGLHMAGYSPGGDMFYGYNGPNEVFRLDLNANSIGAVGTNSGNGFISDVSSDGNKIAYLGMDTNEIKNFVIQDLVTGKDKIYSLAKEYSLHYPSLLQVKFSADGKNVAFVEVKINNSAITQDKNGGYVVEDNYYEKTSLYTVSLDTQIKKVVAENKNGYFKINDWNSDNTVDYTFVPTKDSYFN